MGAAALSDDRVVAASLRIVPIYVDCTKKGDNADLLAKYNVRGYPTVIYTDADGAQLREMQNRDAPGIVKDIETVAGKVAPRPTIWQPSIAFAREIGKKGKKPIAVYFVDPKADLAKVHLKLMKDLGDRKTKFLWVLESGQEQSLKKHQLESAPAVIVLDPKADEPLARIPIREDEKADVLNRALDEAAKLLKK
jgi:hypothetical protein